jgi:hypothetical protein
MTVHKTAAIGTIVLLVLAAAACAGAGGWVRDSFQRLVSEHEPNAGLDLTTDGLDLGRGSVPEAYGYTPGSRRTTGPGAYVYGPAFGPGRAPGYEAPAESFSRLVPYAGLGIGAIKLSMKLGNRDLVLGKEKGERQSRVFAGLGYAIAPNMTLGLEYRALAGGDPLVSVDLGGLAFDIDNPFEDHDVYLRLGYRF